MFAGESVDDYSVLNLLSVKSVCDSAVCYPQKNSTHICAVKIRRNIESG